MIFENISLDQKQQNLVHILESIAVRVHARYRKNSILSTIKKLVSKSTSYDKNNIYIYGGVGRGKTMIMREFFKDLPNPKLLIHYQDFMKMVHEDVHSTEVAAMQDVDDSVQTTANTLTALNDQMLVSGQKQLIITNVGDAPDQVAGYKKVFGDCCPTPQYTGGCGCGNCTE